jgi:hypothetical protein
MWRPVSRLTKILLGLVLLATLTPRPVMAQIAPGVTQSAAHTANITGLVTQSDGKPVAGASVELNGPTPLSTQTDVHGVFIFRTVPWGTYQLLVHSSFGTAEKDKIALSGDINVAIQFTAATGLKTIADVSTSGAGAHINVTSSSISSVTPSDYAFSGNSNWQNLFAQIPGVAVSGYSYGGSGFVGSERGAPQAPAVLSLNGALPYETSTTLDGMPLQGVSSNAFIEQTGGGLDLSTLPLNAFSTADIVRGPGANAPSIVDSIGGSFVLHPPGETTGNHFEFSASNDPYGGIISNARLGLHLGRLSATLIYGINDSPGPLGTSNVIAGLPATPATINGMPVAAPISAENPNRPGVPNCYCSATSSLLISGIPQSTAWSEQSGAVDLAYDIGSSVKAEVFYAGETSKQNYVEGYFPVEFAPAAATPPYSGSFAPSPPGEPSYSFLTQESAQSVLSEATSLLEEKITASTSLGVFRVAALQFNSYNFQEGTEGYDNGTYKLWGTANLGTGAGVPTAFNGTNAQLTFPDVSFVGGLWTNNRDLLFSYATQVGKSSSAGISYITSYYNAPYYDNEVADGTTIPFLSQASAASSTTDETRLHFDTDLSDKLSLGFSWYFTTADFHVPVPSDTSEWTNSNFAYNAPRLGAVWRLGQNVALRASAGGGFALPALPNLTGYNLECGGGQCSEIAANLNLKPEETFGFDVGADARVQRNTVFSIDLYRTNLFGQFFQGTTVSTLNGEPLYITQYGNLGTSRMEGLNLSFKRDVPRGYYWSGSLGLTHAYVLSVPTGFYNNGSCPHTACTNQSIVPGANFISNTYDATVPYASGSGTLGYRWAPGRSLDLTSTYYGNNNIFNVPHAFVVLDAHGRFDITKNVGLLVTFENITGAYDGAIENFGNIGNVTPVVPNSVGYYPGASYIQPYGPRAAIVTLQYRY